MRINQRIYFSGTTAVNEKGQIVGRNFYEQANFIFDKIKTILEKEKFSQKDIISVTAYLVNMKYLPKFNRVFKERFSNINPTCTLVGINQLHDKKLLIEIACFAEKR